MPPSSVSRIRPASKKLFTIYPFTQMHRKMKFRKFLSFRNRVVVIVVGALLGGLSLLYTNNLALRLRRRSNTMWPSGPTPWSD